MFRQLVYEYASQADKLRSIWYVVWASARVTGTRWQWPGKHMPSVPGYEGARGGAALQAGRSRVRFQMVSLEFFIDINLPAAL